MTGPGAEIREELNAEAALDDAREEHRMRARGYGPVYEDDVQPGETIVPHTSTPRWTVGGAVVTDDPVEVLDVKPTWWTDGGGRHRGPFDDVVVPVRGGEEHVTCEKIRRHECGQLVAYGVTCPCEDETDREYDHEQVELVEYAASRGMMCYECGVEHPDWVTVGGYGIDDGYHCGIIDVLACKWCGSIEECGRR